MTEWLDNCIASAWMAHAGSADVKAQLLRSELKQQQLQQQGPTDPADKLLSTTNALGIAQVPSPALPAVYAAVKEPANPALPAVHAALGEPANLVTALAAAAFTANPSHKSSLAAKFAVIANADSHTLIPASEALQSVDVEALVRAAAGERNRETEAALDAAGPAGLGSRALWSSMLQAVSTCASSLTQHMASSCFLR
jgi:hypothetical protein